MESEGGFAQTAIIPQTTPFCPQGFWTIHGWPKISELFMDAFANRCVLITGAGKGIGRQLAKVLSADGAAIAAVDLAAEPLIALEKDLSGKPFAWATADVVDAVGLANAVNGL